jgi:hypothetical protein
MIIKELFCAHKDLEFLGNVYGDLIDTVSTYKKINRSAWRCKKCGKFIFKETFGDILHESYNDYLSRM